MTPIIPSLSPLFEFQLPRNIFGTGTEVRFVVFIPDQIKIAGKLENVGGLLGVQKECCPLPPSPSHLNYMVGMGSRYSDKTDHGQNGPDKTDHVSGQNGPRLRTKRTTFQDKTDQASGQNGPGFWTKRALF